MSKPEPELSAAPGTDPRVDFRKDRGAGNAPAHAEAPQRPAGAEPAAGAAPAAGAEPTAEPARAPEPAAEPARNPAPEPVDPWAPPADHPPQAAPLPSQAPPQPPPPPLPAGGWASVPPSAQSGVQPGAPQPTPGASPNPYGAPFPYGSASPSPYQPRPERRTNGFAVGSLASGLSLLSPVAVVFGIIALTQINRRKERGRAMAVIGLVLGVIGTVLLALLFGAGDFGSARDGRYVRKAPPGAVRWSALKAGDCYDVPSAGSAGDGNGDETVYWVRRLPCSAPHHGEVAGTSKVPEDQGPYPGETAMRERAAVLCRPVLGDYALDQWAVPDGMDDVYLYPTSGNWDAGERYVTCAFEDRDDQHVGTVRTDRASLTAAQLAYLEAVRAFNDTYTDAPKQDVAGAEAEYRSWARRMAVASRAEAAALRKPTADWSADVKPAVEKLAEAQSQAAAAWDAATSGADLAGDLRRARSLVAKTAPISVEIRRGLGLATGEQAPDLRV
ncbi:DUF4190 domain-containing protein [Kitasatospora sp. NPDC001539]|uniref:DUF4190 domain-containing protein n=1 Tax=Kitasatospora sp. NPDC001539 TaxID=3154384 RepID=UPI00332E6D20